MNMPKLVFKDTWFVEKQYRNFLFLYDIFAWGLMVTIVVCAIAGNWLMLYIFAAGQFALTLALNKSYKLYLKNLELKKNGQSKK